MQDCTPRTAKPTVSWYFGSTGTGKTRCVYETEDSLWSTSAALTFFNGYLNQRVAVFDDFRGSFCKFRELLRLLDRYQHTVNIKNGFAEWNSDRIYITSNVSPNLCYQKEAEDMRQLIRRIDNIVEFVVSSNGTVSHRIIKGEFDPGPPGRCWNIPNIIALPPIDPLAVLESFVVG